jgi:hypothetical protein
MPLWRCSEARDAAWALAFALWCVAWPAGIVLAGGKTPGFFSLRGDDGLREMVTFFLPLPYGTALFAWGVVAFAAMWMLLRLRRWLDPEGQALDSIRWALSSRSLNLTLAMLMLSTVLLIVLGEAGVLVPGLMSIDIALGRFLVAWWWPILLVATAILYPVAMLCLLNPRALARDRFERWWRPFWPGLVAVLVAMLCWELIPIVTALAWRYLPASVAPWIPTMLLDYLIVLACDLAAFSWWFSRERASSARGLAARLFRWPSVRLYLGLDLLVGLWVLVVAVPMVMLDAFVIYVGPKYESWQRDSLLEMAYGLLMDLVRMFREEEWLTLGILVGDLYLAIALARLLHRSLLAVSPGEGSRSGVDGAGR